MYNRRAYLIPLIVIIIIKITVKTVYVKWLPKAAVATTREFRRLKHEQINHR